MRHLVLLALAAGLAGCGGGQSASQGTTAETVDDDPVVVDEAVDDSETSAGDEEEVEAPATGPGQLRVINRVGGQESTGRVRVLDSSGSVVAEGSSGDTFTVPSGTYTVAGEITDAQVLLDTPSRESESTVTVVAGQEQTATVDHPVSRVRLRVTRAGRPVANWRMEVRRQGTEGRALEIRPSERHVPITPGRYDATLHIGGTDVEVTGIIFQGGATMDVPVAVN